MLLKYVLIAFLLANAAFWGLFKHSAHCNVSAKLGVTCVKHSYHQMAGGAMLLAALALWFFWNTN